MKTKLHSLFIGLAFIADVHQTTAQVTNLGIAPLASGQSLLYWPVSTTNYVLQTVTNLTSTNWVTSRTAFAVKWPKKRSFKFVHTFSRQNAHV